MMRPFSTVPFLCSSRQYSDAWRHMLNVPFRCTATTASQSSSAMLKIIRSRRMPALLTTMLSLPNVSRAHSTMRLAALKSATLSPLATASPPFFLTTAPHAARAPMAERRDRARHAGERARRPRLRPVGRRLSRGPPRRPLVRGRLLCAADADDRRVRARRIARAVAGTREDARGLPLLRELLHERPLLDDVDARPLRL